MPERDAASFSAVVSGLIDNGELDEALRLLHEGRQKCGDNIDLVHAYNTLIAGYSKRGRVDDARHLFDQIRGEDWRFKRNVVSWNTMIMCYVKAGDILSARELFDQKMERDMFSWNTLISGYISSLDMKEASKLFLRMSNPDIMSWNLMISGFAQMGNMELAQTFFVRMPQRNQVSWNSIIAGYEENADYEGAIKLFIQMQWEGGKPDRHSLFTSERLCRVCGSLSGDADPPTARIVFDEMKLRKDVTSWNAVIGGYASHGFAAEALELFRLMKQHNVRPTYITFISVFNACAHAGLVELGQMHFKSMVSEFGVQPGIEHFASLVDILGRNGQAEEAMDVINRMPFKPDKAVWGALLGACRLHNNVKLARVAAEALMRLEPESSATYLLLYNLYADIGLRDEATEIKMLMERNNVGKEPGYSRVDTNS
ncbi:hypothetical protein RJ639_011161 [Escallonia herrerae]|uniref:Pentatricopeptide repeat-containing protein n=1 Tax=Escallonia herrerae TaxID=1293975 RepID=A0AA88VRT4_9ASTE|nr:hypothetical protein RJ639_011161 [Escallonia herrerae]